MNSSKTNQILKSVESELQLQSTDSSSMLVNLGQISLQTAVNGSKLDTANSRLLDIKDSTADTDSTLGDIDSNIFNMNASTTANNALLTNIESDVSELNRTKMLFNARLTDGVNPYLDRLDYSVSPIIFSWQNDKGVPVYINKYTFAYVESNEPTSQQLYHSTAWESKIGAVNSGETDFEAPFVTKNDNFDYYRSANPNDTKKQWTSNVGWCYEHDFSDAPIEIGVSRKFGHNIQADLTTSLYDSDPVGIIEGYYYSA